MDPRVICDIWNSTMNLDMIPDDIILPKAERIQELYRRFLLASMEIPEQSLHQLPLECNEPEFAETHSRGIPITILYATMASFVADFCSANDLMFTMCDLVNPEPRRTRKFLSIFADYIKWHSSSIEAFDSVAEQYDGQRKELEAVLAQVSLEERRKSELRSQEDVRMRNENALLAELGQRNNQFAQLLKSNDECEAKREANIAAMEQEKRIKTDLSNEKDSLMAQLDHLSKGIIRSPERVLKELDQQRDELCKVREECDRQRHVNSDREAQLELASNIEKMISQLAQEVKQIDAQKHDLETRRQEKGEVDRSNADAARQLAHLQELVKAAEQDALHAEQTKRNEESVHKERMDQLQEQVSELHNDVISLRESAKGAKTEARLLQKEIVTVKGECADTVRDAKKQLGELTTVYSSFTTAYEDEYHQYLQIMDRCKKALQSLDNCMSGSDEVDMNLTGNATFMSERNQ